MLVVADLYDSTLCEGFIPPLLKSAIVPSLPKVTPPKCIEDDDHLILMEKLSTKYNLHWSLFRWVASFLQARAQVTGVGA